MANETLSPRQAKQISVSFEDIINSAVKQIEGGFNEFFNDMAQEWEDNNAVSLSKNLKSAMDEVTNHLNSNCQKFIDTLNQIASGYAQTGNMKVGDIGSFTANTLSIVANIKNTFDGDEFGFKNVDSPDRVAEAMNKLVKKLQSTISETVSKLRGINAFGNQQVLANLATSGGEVVHILQDAVQQVEKETKNSLTEAANAYKDTGSKATDAAKISTNG